MEAVLKRSDNDIVEVYWNMLSTLSRTVKQKLASRLTTAILEEKTSRQENYSRKAKVRRRPLNAPSDAELEAKFADLVMPACPQDDFTCEDIIKAKSGKTIKPIEKWL